MEEVEQSWVDKVVVSLLLLLRDWLMVLPLLSLAETSHESTQTTVRTVFEVVYFSNGIVCLKLWCS